MRWMHRGSMYALKRSEGELASILTRAVNKGIFAA